VTGAIAALDANPDAAVLVDAIEDAACALLSPPGQEREFRIAGDAYALPPVLRAGGRALKRQAYWRERQRQMAELFAVSGEVGIRVSAILALLLCDAVLDPSGAGLGAFVERVAVLGPKNFRIGLPFKAKILAGLMDRAGYFSADVESFRMSLETLTQHIVTGPDADLGGWSTILELVLGARLPPVQGDVVVERLLVPILRHAAGHVSGGALMLANQIDMWIARTGVKLRETAAHFTSVQTLTAPLLANAGRAFRQASSQSAATLNVVPGRPIRVGFVLHTSSRLAHTETLITFLRGLAQLPARPIEPRVLYPYGRSAQRRAVTGSRRPRRAPVQAGEFFAARRGMAA
jgi:hypothetical protein